jgi:large subunit ribosomal protein L15
MLELNNLRPTPGARRRRKRVGRGPSSGSGKTSGRGHKGQKARSGYSRRGAFEGGQMPLSRRLPKRGFHHEQQYPLSAVNLDVLDKHFESGAEVTAEALVAKRLIKGVKGGVKVLGRGELTKKLNLKVAAISGSARGKVEAAGGSIELHEAAPARAVVRRGQGTSKES